MTWSLTTSRIPINYNARNIRGASKHILDEAERSVHDALCVLTNTIKNKRTTYGGGYPEMVMAKACEELARMVPGK